MALPFRSALLPVLLALTLPCLAQDTRPAPAGSSDGEKIEAPGQPSRQTSGTVSGTVVDRSGAVVAGARVSLTRGGEAGIVEVLSGANGQFSFAGLVPGPFSLTVTAAGFAAQTVTGTLNSEQVFLVPQIVLTVATANTEVRALGSSVEVAQEQVREEEKQRVLRVIPNFYVTYVPDAVALNSKQKFELAWKTLIDPFSFIAVGGVAGIQQAQNNFKDYGQGAQGYAKRYGAAYGDFVSGTLIGAAVLPSLLKQDPRYFYKGTGGKRSRILYALANSVICKGDNGHWQANYSSILGNLAAGGISNLYYPAEDRNGARLTFENAAIGIGTTGAINLFEEFVVRKFTSNAPATVEVDKR